MRSLDFLEESIEDTGIFKACFMSGLPGAGKSTVISKITNGGVDPRIVNTDKTYEFLLGKHSKEANATAWNLLGPISKTMNNKMLYYYLNSVLPLFVDGTSSNTGALLHRAGILEGLGYDTMMIWINVDIETAIQRAQERTKRPVDERFIRYVFRQMDGNKEYYKSRFGANFIEVDNNGDNFGQMEGKTYNIANQFFLSEVKNPVGKQTIKKMEQTGEKYLTPNIHSEEHLKSLVSNWYQS